MSIRTGIRYQDLLQLQYFPDGSSLQQRQDNAALLQQACGMDARDHLQALQSALVLNHTLSDQLGALLEPAKPSWLPRFMANANQNASRVWFSETRRQLDLLFESLQQVVSFTAQLGITVTGFTSVQQQWIHVGSRLYLEDRLGHMVEGVQPPITFDNSEPLHQHDFIVPVDNCRVRLEVVLKHVAQGMFRLPQLWSPKDDDDEAFGQALLNLRSVPVNNGPVRCDLPVYRVEFDPLQSTDSSITSMDVRVVQTQNMLGTMHCNVEYITDTLPVESVGSRFFLVTKIRQVVDRLAEIREKRQKFEQLRERFPEECNKGIRRCRWQFTGYAIVFEHLAARLCSKNQGTSQESILFASYEDREGLFLQLTTKVWELWRGMLKQQKQPISVLDTHIYRLYSLLEQYDGLLKHVLKNEFLAGKHLPGMPWFHMLFVFSAVQGIRSVLLKLAFAYNFLRELLSDPSQLIDGHMLKFLLEVWRESNRRFQEKMLTAQEAGLYSHLTNTQDGLLVRFVDELLRNHFTKMNPEDASGRKLLLLLSNHVSSKPATVHLLQLQSESMMKELLSHCKPASNLQRAWYVMSAGSSRRSTAGNGGSGLDMSKVEQIFNDLIEGWSVAAKVFEVMLGLQGKMKGFFNGWDLVGFVIHHYQFLSQTTESFLTLCPMWPYHLQDWNIPANLNTLHGLTEKVNQIMITHGLAPPPVVVSAGSKKLDLEESHTSSTTDENMARISRPSATPSYYEYKVTVYTSNYKGAGLKSDAIVSLVIHGDASSSGRVVLSKDKAIKASKKLFDTGVKDEFSVKVPECLGGLHDLEVNLEQKVDGLQKAKLTWNLDRIEVTDAQTKQVWYFTCNAWISTSVDLHQVQRIISGNILPPSERSAYYEIEIQTSNVKHAGTCAKVHIQLFGSSGNSNKFWLERSSTNNFDQGKFARFTVKSKQLGAIEEVVMGIEPSRSIFGVKNLDDWHVEYAMVTNKGTGGKWLFKVDSWFKDKSASSFKDDAPTRKIKFDGSEVTEYQVYITTANEKNASTDSRVYIILEGTESISKRLYLQDGSTGSKKTDGLHFRRGAKAAFSVYWSDLGTLQKVTVGHDGSGSWLNGKKNNAWKVEDLTIIDVAQCKRYYFPCNFWLGASGKMKLEQAAAPTQVVDEPARKIVYYQPKGP